ncbi:MAG: site-2 protease family protein [Actinomycetota bacterium]
MRRFRLPVGSIMGVRLWLHASWFLVAGLAVWAMTDAFGKWVPGLPFAERLLMGVASAIAFFGCLVTHELAHSVVARRFGVRVRGITLFMLGGVAEIEGEIPAPAQEFAVALAGPATSLALGALFALLWRASSALGWTWAEGVTFTVAAVNLGVALFNLIPGLPLDGGRILRAALWHRSGDHAGATRIASGAGRVLAVLLALAGIATAWGGDVAGLWYVPMGGFIFLMARSAGRAAPPGSGRALAWVDEPRAAGTRS